MTTAQHHDITELTDLAGRLADAAAVVTLAHFRSPGLVTSNKEQDQGFDPVTVADRGAEAAIRAILAAERPDDGIFGEEQENVDSTSGWTWILDPIDGTRAFISGLPVWGTLIALDDGARGRIGIIDQPHIGERFIGIQDGAQGRAWFERHGKTQPLRTRGDVALADATMLTTDPYLFEGAEANAFARLRSKARLTRYGTDCYAYAMVAMGTIDLVVETGLQAYDIASHVPLIEAAGGRVTDWEGGDCRWGGRVIAAGSAALHAEAMDVLHAAG